MKMPGRRSGRRAGARTRRPLVDRLRRRTMAPSRPLLYPEQIGLALFSLLAIGGGIYFAVKIAL